MGALCGSTFCTWLGFRQDPATTITEVQISSAIARKSARQPPRKIIPPSSPRVPPVYPRLPPVYPRLARRYRVPPTYPPLTPALPPSDPPIVILRDAQRNE